MKIKFYHWWIYRLFFRVWTPIFKERPDIHKAFVKQGVDWIEKREQEIKERRSSFKVIE